MFRMSEDECHSKFNPQYNIIDDDDYQHIKLLRIIIISLSSTALFINIIIIQKQYVFPTIKLLMFVEACYILSLISVSPHNASLNIDVFVRKNDQDFYDLTECIASYGHNVLMALEGWVNLTSYAISYWCAVMITFYIRLVLKNKHKLFLKSNKILIFGVMVLISLWYSVPFILTFINNVPFSFGPVGYEFKGIYYFFYSGIINRYTKTDNQLYGKILVFTWMSLVPFICFFYHTFLLYKNHKHTKELLQSQVQINERELYTIKSGRLSYVILIVQLFNVAKFILALYASDIPWLLTFILNIVYDLLGFVLIIIYFCLYYKQGRNIRQQSSTTRYKSLISENHQ